MKPKSWRRYEGSRVKYVDFHRFVWPAEPEPTPPYDASRVADWVGDLVADGVKTAATAVAGLNKFHVSAGGVSLREHPAVAQALAGWERVKPPPQPKQPFTESMLDEVYAREETSSLRGARDFAMLAVAHGGAFRGESELLAARLPVRHVPDGCVVDVHTKTDRGVWTTSARRIPKGSGGRRTPFGALMHYLALSGHSSGCVFRNISGGGAHARSNARPVSRSSLGDVVKRWAAVLGFDPSKFGTHSMKHGQADDLKAANVPEEVGMRVTNHRSAAVYRGYGSAGRVRQARAAARRRANDESAASRVAATALERDAWAASG